MLNDACARLRFGECDTAEVPELLRSLSHLPREERLAAVYALAFGASIGCFRDEKGNLDKAIAKALKEMHLLAEYHDSSRMLSNARDNINLYRVGKMNLLCAAAEEGNLPMIRGLVRLGAYVNVPSPNGDTALATAVATRQWAACVELISLGALPTLPDKSGYPMIYHLVSDFCKNVPESEALVGLIRYLIQRGVRFTIPVKNPDEKARAEIPTVLVSDLLCSKAEQWQRYGHLLLGFGGKAPAVALPGRAIDIPASTNTTTTPGIKLVNAFPAAALKRNQGSAGAVAADAASPPDAVSASNIDRMLAADDELASFIAWLGRDARRYRWQDAQSGQGLLHRAVAMGNFEAVRLLLERGLDRRLVDRQGRTPAQLLPASHMRSARLADLLER
jgi:ankyrin repeat protein